MVKIDGRKGCDIGCGQSPGHFLTHRERNRLRGVEFFAPHRKPQQGYFKEFEIGRVAYRKMLGI